MRHFLLFFSFLLLANELSAQGLAQPYLLDSNDRAGLRILQQYSFINTATAIPDSLSFNQYTIDTLGVSCLNNAGVVMDIVNNEWRVTGLTLTAERQRQINALPLLSISDIAPAFSNGRLAMLKFLYLGFSGLTGDMNSFPMVDSLRDIDFKGNQLTNVDKIVNDHSALLERAIFSQNRLTNIPPLMFRNCPNLEDVNFAFNDSITALPTPDMTDTITLPSGLTLVDLPFYSGLGKLKYLKLQGMGLTGTFHLEHFLGAQLSLGNTTLHVLQELRINNNDIDNISPYFLDAVLNSSGAVALCLADLQFLNLQPSTADTVITVQNNRLDFEDLRVLMVSIGYNSATAPTFMTYAPQDSLGVGGVRRRGTGQALNFSLEAEDASFANRNEPVRLARAGLLGFVRDNYIWKWGPNLASIGVVATYTQGTSPAFSTILPSALIASSPALKDASFTVLRPTLYMASNQGLDESLVYTNLTNARFPALTLYSKKKMIVFGECFDSLGQVIQCQEMSIQFDDTTSMATRAAARRDFGAKVISSCVCNKVELWELSDTFQSISMEANGAGTRRASSQASAKPGLKSADPNYPLLWTTPAVVDTNPNIANSLATASSSRTLVAIIDSGADPDHPVLSANLRRNINDPIGNGDDDGNCEIDDIIGYNFVDRNNKMYDDHGHGTIVGGIVAGYGTPNLNPTDTALAILPIKYTDRMSRGTSYEASCAIYYAADYQLNNNNNGSRRADSVRVINASWGYQGEYCRLLHDAIDYAGKNCGILFVCSSGNDTSDNDQVAHYPSNFELDNILAVSACNSMGQLATYANYGAGTVDIAAQGTFTNTLAPQLGSLGTGVNATPKSGTSFATAMVSRAAGLLFHAHPDAGYVAVKKALMATATPLAGSNANRLRSGGQLNYNAALAYLDTMSNRNACAHQLTIGVAEELATTAANTVRLMPNPSRGELQISFENLPATSVEIRVIDLSGRILLQKTVAAQLQIDLSLSNLPDGFYLVHLQQNGVWSSHKLIKMQ
jgi:Leucine-rich repeat (LRR) protein